MKIQVGIGNKREFEYFLREGVDEFYAGLSFLPSHLYGGENFKNLDEVIDIIKIAKSNGKRFYLVINEVIDKDFKEIVSFLRNFDKRINIDGFILRDIGVIKEIKNLFPRKYLILSTLGFCFNEKSLEFYSKMGINRICLPEHIIPLEAKKLIKNKYDIDIEILLGAIEFCLVFNGFCYLWEFKKRCICREGFIIKDKKIYSLPRFSIEEHFKNFYDLYKMGVKIIKIGRGPDNIYARFIIHEVKYLIKIIKKCKKEDFVKQAVDFHVRYRKKLFEKFKK